MVYGRVQQHGRVLRYVGMLQSLQIYRYLVWTATALGVEGGCTISDLCRSRRGVRRAG